MASVRHMLPRLTERTIVIAATIGLAVVGLISLASGQDQNAAIVKDAIFARKILMNAISTNMDELETMTGSDKPISLTKGHEYADNISVMLMAFPHLFGAATNQWKPNVERDPGRDTYASPDLFTNYAEFYARAASASKTAFRASRAEKESEFRNYVAELRVACDSCHGLYLKTDQ